ncbi:MAG: cyaB 1, partial [Solirubrobacterales bacterium]|nr:cyaB 1 [Solirubrobacterales bacterium]
SKNAPNVVAAQEIAVKVRTAVLFRSLAQDHARQKVREASLLRFMDPKVAASLVNDGLPALRKQCVTIVFWDIRGFSAAADSLKAQPALLSQFLTEYFTLASVVVFKHGGVLDKFIGDGVMGLFGALEHDESRDALSAARAAVEMKATFEPLAVRWQKRWALAEPAEVVVGLGCGIHTGEVLVGAVEAEGTGSVHGLGLGGKPGGAIGVSGGGWANSC